MISFARRQLRLSVSRFAGNASGSILPIVAVMVVILIVVAGAAVDYSRAVNNREKMAHALDAAGLTLAAQLSTKVMTNEEINALLKASFAANIQTLGLDDVAISNLTHSVDPDKGIIDITTKVSVPTLFVSIGGIGPKNLDVSVSTEVNYSRFEVELALVLDVTGSMWNDIDTLKQASSDLLNTLIPDGTPPSDSKVKISVIPYSQGVNLGSYAATVSNWHATNNCVTERAGEAQFTDAPYNYTPWYPTLAPTSYFGGGSYACPRSSMSLLPLTSDRSTIKNKINSLDDGGGTAGQIGAAWGWYTLSPNWANLWPAGSAPGAYNNSDLLKFAVIMTDGENNDYYTPKTEKKNCRPRYDFSTHRWKRVCDTVVVWSETVEWDDTTYNNVSSTRQRAVCQAMKDKGITVYGIYFGTDTWSVGARNMSSCATDGSTFYLAKSRSELINAFGNIAKKIQAIYLGK